MNLKATILAATLVTAPFPAYGQELKPLDEYMLENEGDAGAAEYTFMRCSALFIVLGSFSQSFDNMAQREEFKNAADRMWGAAQQMREEYRTGDIESAVLSDITLIAELYFEQAQSDHLRTGSYFGAAPFVGDTKICTALVAKS